MGYVESILASDETILGSAKVTGWMYFNPAYLVVLAFLRIWSTEMVVTNRRVIFKAGIISRKTTEISLRKIESVGVQQSILGRILNYGDVVVTGTGHKANYFAEISAPMEFKQAIDTALNS